MSDSLLKNLLSFVAGLAVAILIFVAGYRVLSPVLSAIDGSLWAAWAQVIAIAVAAGLAAVIAFGQLKALQKTLEFSTKTTKVKNAIDLANQVYEKMTIGGIEISPMEATGEIHKTRYAPGALEEFRAAYRRILSNAVRPGDEPEAERVSYAIAAVNNYFGGMHRLLQTEAMDNDFVLDRFSRLCLDTYNEVVELRARPPREEFYQMAQASYAYMEAHGQNPVVPPNPYSIVYIRAENL